MNTIAFTTGSEWRKWDLHVHTASSYDAYQGNDADELLVEAWNNHEFAAVAVTDHAVIDSSRIQRLGKLAPHITIFPGFEIRTDKGAANLHVVAIFPETSDLTILQQDFEAILMRSLKKSGEKNDTIIRDLKDIANFTQEHKGILTIHAGHKTNGIDKEITNALPANMAIKKEIAEFIDIFEVGRIEDVADYRKHVFQFIDEKPLILCSDNHNPKEYTIKEYLWVKADPTFQGLVQTIMQPSERVFIGNLPEKLDKFSKNKSSHIANISVSRVPSPKVNQEHWFDSSLELNHTLVAIIGNKGSGKSALSDIIGHACRSKNIGEASFLIKERFRKPPENKARDYQVAIEWCDGKKEIDISLDSADRITGIEDAQYLPQKYIETVCNDLSNEFQKEIDSVIFSYVDPSERAGANHLNELIANRSKPMITRIDEIKSRLKLCNENIIRLESRLIKEHKKLIKAALDKRREDLERHRKSKPEEVSPPSKEPDADYTEALNVLKKQIEELQNEDKNVRDKLAFTNEKINRLRAFQAEIQVVSENIDKLNVRLIEFGKSYDISADLLKFTYQAPNTVVELLGKDIIERDRLRILLDSSEENLEMSLSYKIQKAQKEMASLIANANNVEKTYQKYLADLNEWKKFEVNIIGDNNIEGSIKYLEAELEHLSNDLPKEYETKKEERKSLLKELFQQKRLVAGIYSEIYQPIEKELEPLLHNSDDKIEFNVNIVLTKRDIGENLLSHIRQSMTGQFQGKQEAHAKMKDIIDATNFDDIDSVISFVDSVLVSVYEDIDASDKKIKSKTEFYNTLTSLDYIDAEYNLALGGRKLQMLSPGERGIVLMVFYLALSKNNCPLIIDQPEDNLDNQSVFSRLVPCIREAKKKRQVIIVTHNPNIAIACDAEQIICSSIDKNDNRITYISGSIENPEIRKRVIDILEGTMPAFELRKLKYTYARYGQ